MPFPFENLKVYQKAMTFASEVESLTKNLQGKVSKTYVDQLSRAALSIPLNIAEGNGRWHKGDKRQFFWIARGSAFECIPVLQIMEMKGHISLKEHDRRKGELEEIAKMLTSLIKSTESLQR